MMKNKFIFTFLRIKKTNYSENLIKNDTKNEVSDMTSDTDYEEIPYIILDKGQVHFKDQIKTNDDNESVFKKEKKNQFQLKYKKHWCLFWK